MFRSRGLKIGTAVALALAAATPALSSSHREAPNITETPKVDNTDVYAFRSYEPGRAGFVTLIANFQPFQDPGGGPNYFTMDPDALYEIMIDNNGDAREDLTYQFKFDNGLQNGRGIQYNIGGKTLPIALRHDGQVASDSPPTIAEYELFNVFQVQGDRRSGTRTSVVDADRNRPTFIKPFDNVGNKTIADYPGYSDKFIYNISIPGCDTRGRVFVGQRAEYFAVNLGPIFDLVNFVPISGDNDPMYGNGQPFPGGITQSQANQELIQNYNVTTLAIEIPIAEACIDVDKPADHALATAILLKRARDIATIRA